VLLLSGASISNISSFPPLSYYTSSPPGAHINIGESVLAPPFLYNNFVIQCPQIVMMSEAVNQLGPASARGVPPMQVWYPSSMHSSYRILFLYKVALSSVFSIALKISTAVVTPPLHQPRFKLSLSFPSPLSATVSRHHILCVVGFIFLTIRQKPNFLFSYLRSCLNMRLPCLRFNRMIPNC